MITFYTLATFGLIHWIFDFHLQSDRMAKNKSTCNFALIDHVGVYTVGLLIMAISNVMYFNQAILIVPFLFLNSFLHFLTDWITSRASSALYKESRIHDFFVVIGFDQYLHALTLFGTFVWLSRL